VLYSSGLVAGKRRQKKHIEPAKNATDATPVTENNQAFKEVEHNITNLNIFLFY